MNIEESVERVNELELLQNEEMKEMFLKAIELGNTLWEVKNSMSHGEFLPWFMTNCKFPVWQAVKYMELAKKYAHTSKVDYLMEIIKLSEKPKRLVVPKWF